MEKKPMPITIAKKLVIMRLGDFVYIEENKKMVLVVGKDENEEPAMFEVEWNQPDMSNEEVQKYLNNFHDSNGIDPIKIALALINAMKGST